MSNSANSATSITITNTNGGASAVANTKYTNSASTHEFGILPTGYGGYGVLTAGSAYVYAGNNQALEFAVDNNYMAFGTGTGATERMRIDSSGNVGIGTTATGTKLNVLLGTSYTIGSNWNSSVATFGQATSSGGIAGGALGVSFDTTNGATLSSLNPGVSWYQMQLAGTYIAFRTGGSATEAARIDSSGNLLVGTTSLPSPGGVPTSGIGVRNPNNNGAWTLSVQSSGATTNRGIGLIYSGATPNDGFNEAIYFTDATAVRFIVKSNGGISNYSANNTNLSDERTKKDISDAGNYLDKICAIPVRTFLYKDQTDTQLNLGVIAQEVEKVAPELVDKSGFGETPADGIPLKAIYQTDLQYALMKAIQEQQALITTLQTQVAALQAKVGA